MAMAYENVYVAQVAMGASAQQTLNAFCEAEAHHGPSLIVAYGHCIAHGIDMGHGLQQQKLAVDCGHWPLYRYRPAVDGRLQPEFLLDSPPPRIPFERYACHEIRYQTLLQAKPQDAAALLAEAQSDIELRWQACQTLAERWPAAAVRPGRRADHRAVVSI